MQDPQQTNIDSVIHSDDTQTPPADIAVARVSNGSATGNSDKTDKSDKATGRVKVATTNGNGSDSNFRLNNATGLKVERRFTQPGEDVYSTVEWELRDAVISNERGEKVFEQKNCEIPKSWTQLATNVVVSKYFRGHVGTPEREHSVRQLIGRVADTIANWGRRMDYFATEADAQTFQDELTHILLHQKAAFNSPVWFNVGLKDQPVPQASACFINSVDDTMESILTLAKTEGMLFKFGSGTGTNLSTLRGSNEKLKGGGTASGPLSFMRGFDQFAAAIKSGGKTRRAAKMVLLDVNHPDIEPFIVSKADEEKKAWALIDAGYSGMFNVPGGAYDSVQFQNANHSVRVTDEFMQTYLKGGQWTTRNVTDNQPNKTYQAADLMKKIGESAWICGDPGMQYDTTINKWHTCKNTDKINASNPCCFVGETLVDTSEGRFRFDQLEQKSSEGETLPCSLSFDMRTGKPVLRSITKVWVAGETCSLVDVRTRLGVVLRCTPEHKFLTHEGQYVAASELQTGTRLRATSRSHFAQAITQEAVADTVDTVTSVTLDYPVKVYDLEVADVHNLSVTNENTETGHSIVVSNSEFVFLDDTACNLSSLNLMKFRNEQYDFDVEAFKHACRVMIIAQETLVDNASYPTPRIQENSHDYRPLGLGYANLGALLMARGLAYDSDEGRAYAGAITAIMTGEAYHQSAIIARDHGWAFPGYHKNREPMLDVMRMHRQAVEDIDGKIVPAEMMQASRKCWDDAIEVGTDHGYRNAQTTVTAPTGTISFLMDCDTTGIEPDIAIVKYKNLVGGGMMKIVNNTVPEALMRLGYSETEVKSIIAYIDAHDTIEGAPDLKPEHLSIFDCAFKPGNGVRSIQPMGHVRMMAAAQPFLSGAISKCVIGSTLLTTARGLTRISSLYQGEKPGTFRPETMTLASLGGTRNTDAFYYGGGRPTLRAKLRSGHCITGTFNHRLLVGREGRLDWVRLDDIKPGDYVATQYGANMWASEPAQLPLMPPASTDRRHKTVSIPAALTTEMAWLLGAYASEGHTTRSTWTIVITNSVEAVLERAVAAWRSEFGVEARIERQSGKCPGVIVSSKRLVQLFEALGIGRCSFEKRIPDVVLSSPKEMALSFLAGLFLDGYATADAPGMGKVAICLNAPELLDDLQAILTNLGLVHSRISKLNRVNGKTYDEVYMTGEWAQQFIRQVPFMEPDKSVTAERLLKRTFTQSTANIVPGIAPAELLKLIPRGLSGRNGKGTSRSAFNFLSDPRTKQVSRRTLERVAALPGVTLPEWLQTVMRDNLHFSPITEVEESGVQPVFDVSVPVTHAFVGNGIVNHNTCNVPTTATAEDIINIYVEGWKLGLKAIAIYRDGSKRTQPLMTKKADVAKTDEGKGKREEGTETVSTPATNHQSPTTIVVNKPLRRKLPDERAAMTHKFSIAGHEGYITVGMYPDGTPGEIFLTMSKEGSTISGLMDSFATAISLALQYGVPLQTLVDKFAHARFEPSGVTNNPDIRFAKSIMDYIFRWLGSKFLNRVPEPTQPTLSNGHSEENSSTAVVEAPPLTLTAAPTTESQAQSLAEREHETFQNQSDAPICTECGSLMVRNGACYKCLNCGSVFGCS